MAIQKIYKVDSFCQRDIYSLCPIFKVLSIKSFLIFYRLDHYILNRKEIIRIKITWINIIFSWYKF